MSATIDHVCVSACVWSVCVCVFQSSWWQVSSYLCQSTLLLSDNQSESAVSISPARYHHRPPLLQKFGFFTENSHSGFY